MQAAFRLPFIAKASLTLIGIYVFVLMLSIGRGIIVPLIFGTIIAIVLHPLVNFFVKIRFNRVIAIIVTLLLSFILLAAFGLFFYSQLGHFSESWPVFVEKLSTLMNETIQWLPGYFDISADKVNAWLNETKTNLINSSSTIIGQTLISAGNALVAIFLVPVYVFMILYYQPILLEFIHKFFRTDGRNNVSVIVSQTKSVVQRYLIGLFIETLLVAILNSAGLLLLGIDYAILIGVMGALLNLIPYIGGIIGVAMPMMVALVTKDSPWFALYVMAVYYFIQLVDNNYIVPKIVASKVKINALVSIVAVLAGGALWGVAGMFLSIPMTAIIKVICDHIEPLKPIGFLLGDTMPEIAIFKIAGISGKHLKKKKSAPISSGTNS
jgi:predicted PurR-regulated permease PerM